MKKYRRGIESVIVLILAVLVFINAMSDTKTDNNSSNETASVSVCAVYNAE